MTAKVIYFQRMVNLSILLALLVIGLGAYTRLTDAGLGCPDWPGCYGKLTAPSHQSHVDEIQQQFPGAIIEPHKARNEMLHRYVAGFLGLLVLGLWIFSLVIKRWRALTTALCVVILVQALLGMWTVTLNLIPLVVVAHLLGGFFLLSLLVLLRVAISLSQRPIANEPALQPYLPLACVALIILLGQIALGGWTSSNYAALACTQFPLCESGWQSRFSFESVFHLPLGHETYEYGVLPHDARMSIHIAHRVGAAVTCLVILGTLLVCWRKTQSRRLRQLMLAIAGLVIAQATLGVLNVHWHLPLANAVAHNLVAACLLVAVVMLIQQLHWRTRVGVSVEKRPVALVSAEQ